MAKFIRQRVSAAEGGSSPPSAAAGRWEKRFPALSEFLSLCEWEAGKPRLTGSLSIFVDGGVWKCCLSDRDSGHVAFLAAVDPEGLLEGLEKHLREGDLDWRPKRPEQRGPRK